MVSYQEKNTNYYKTRVLYCQCRKCILGSEMFKDGFLSMCLSKSALLIFSSKRITLDNSINNEKLLHRALLTR